MIIDNLSSIYLSLTLSLEILKEWLKVLSKIGLSGILENLSILFVVAFVCNQ